MTLGLLALAPMEAAWDYLIDELVNEGVVINGEHSADMGYLMIDAVQALALAVVDEVERIGAADVRRRIEEFE